MDGGIAITDKNQRWAQSGQRKCLNQALTSQEKGSGSLMSSALKAESGGVEEEVGGRGHWERRGREMGRSQHWRCCLLAPPRAQWPLRHSLAPLEGSEDCRTSVHSCMVFCRAWVFSLST